MDWFRTVLGLLQGKHALVETAHSLIRVLKLCMIGQVININKESFKTNLQYTFVPVF